MINEISRVNSTLATMQDNSKNASGAKTPFSEFFGLAMDNINSVSDTVKVADKLAVDFAVGKLENPETLMIAQEKASLAVSYATTITNKILDVYNEIMRMQI